MDLFNKNLINDLQSDVKKLQKTNANLIEQLHEHEHTISSFMEVKKAHEDEKLQLMKEINHLKHTIETEKKSVARKVNQELATIGVSKLFAEEISENPNTSSSSIVKQFKSMKHGSPEHMEFYNQYRDIIDAFLK